MIYQKFILIGKFSFNKVNEDENYELIEDYLF